MKQGSEFFIFLKNEFICSAALATEKEHFWVNIYSCFNILFSKNLFVQLQYAKYSIQYIYTVCSAKFCWKAYLGIFQKLPDCFGSFRNSFVCFGCFDTGSKHRNKPKKCFFWFHETNRNKRETDLVSVCFGSNRKLFFFISRTPYLQDNSKTVWPSLFILIPLSRPNLCWKFTTICVGLGTE
jgi:hypothetical protein